MLARTLHLLSCWGKCEAACWTLPGSEHTAGAQPGHHPAKGRLRVLRAVEGSPPDGSLLNAVAGGVCRRSPAPRSLPSTPPPGISSVTWSPPRRPLNPDQPWRGTLGIAEDPDSSCDKNKE